jgi:hypothetical protein
MDGMGLWGVGVGIEKRFGGLDGLLYTYVLQLPIFSNSRCIYRLKDSDLNILTSF